MPGSPEEMVSLVNQLMGVIRRAPEMIPDHLWADGTAISEDERREVAALRDYVLSCREKKRNREPQRRAMRLLRRLLSGRQRAELNRLGYFYITTASGSAYRLDPYRGMTERVEKHGKRNGGRWFTKRSYCLHDARDEDRMPPADLSIAHLLLLLSDDGAGESEFLATANETRRDDQLWNRDYLRRIRERRRNVG